jgi:alpha-tubulin suppressor-like RCC1 family protein
MRSPRLALLLLVGLIPAAITCGGDSTGPQLPAALNLVSGNGQSGTVGQALPNPLVVKLVDASGAGVPGVTMLWSAMSGGGALSAATMTTDAVGAAAVTWTLGPASGANTVSASVAGVPTIASIMFSATATPGQAAKLAFTVQPSAVVAGAAISPAVQVTVQDALGNTVSTGTNAISLAITIGSGAAGAVIGGTRTQAAVAGVATFANLTLDKTGASYSLTASSAGLTPDTSAAFAVSPGVAAKLSFTVQPAAAIAGSTIGPALQVAIQDALGNTVTGATSSVTLAITSGTGAAGATVSGSSSKSAVAGVATFYDLSIDKAGTGYSLTASSGSLPAVASAAFTVSPGAAAKLVFTVQPTAVTSGSTISPAVQVAVQDALGNTVTSSTVSVTLAITSGTGTSGAVLGGTLTQIAAGGVATFGSLSIDKAGTGYTLTVTATSLTSATSTGFTVNVGAPARLAFTVQPSGAAAGIAISPAVLVAVQDAQGNTIPTATNSITVGFTPATGPVGLLPTLGGALTRTAANGVATFDDLTIDKAGVGYSLTASAVGLSSATSVTFAVTAGAASKLAFEFPTLTTFSATAGATITPTVRVAVQDALGNTVTTSTISITVAIGTNQSSGTLSGTTIVSAVGGTASFSTLSIDRAGAGYTLTATATDLTGASSASFTVYPGAATKLAFTAQPSDVMVGATITPAAQVSVQDAQGNTVTSSTASITVAITSGTGTTGAVLGGTATVTAISGVATFANLTLDRAGSGYTLTATASGLTGATSSAFAVSVGTAAKLAFTVQPSAANAGAAIAPAVQVTVQDAQGNTATSSTAGITLAITSGTGTSGAVLGGTVTRAAVSGVATFIDLTIDKAGSGYTLAATATDLTGVSSASFTLYPGAATKLAFTAQPSDVMVRATITPAVQVRVQDAQGNTIPTATNSITMSITSGTGTTGAVLGGTATVTAISGVATFANLTIDRAGSGYTLTATASGLTGATSSAFAVSVGTAAKLAFTVQPSAANAGAAIAPAVQVTVQDAQGNTATSSTAGITLAITSGTGTSGAVLGGTVTRAAVSGVATFIDLTIDKAGSGYTLAATATDLTGASSASFTLYPGAATKLAFTAQPSDVMARATITPAVQVSVQDAQGNAVTSSTASITVAITSGTGTTGAALGGTATVTAISGVATFANVTLDRAGSGYTLTVTASGLISAVSSVFTVSALTRLSAGGWHTCGLTTGGAAYCWGTNFLGRLGDGTSGNVPVTSPVAVSGGLALQAISAGGGHSCGLTTGGAAYCWGDGALTPVAVSGGLVFGAMSAGAGHTCGLTTGGAAYCWGSNDSGQVGDGSTSYSTSPVAVSGGLVFQAISAGYHHTCGLTTGGAAYCWGDNEYGQLGDGTTSTRLIPVAVAGGLTFASLKAGGFHTCGLTTGGAASCWGWNNNGQLGDGTGTSRTSPVAVAGARVFQAISAGLLHTCGLTGGAAYCWGNNSSGQLGDGTLERQPGPVAVAGALVFEAISAGYFHTCGVTTGEAAYCWGYNDDGQLGDGTTISRSTPVAVRSP